MNTRPNVKQLITLITVALLTSIGPGSWQASAQLYLTETVPITDQELIRNGAFDIATSSGIDGWFRRGGDTNNAEIVPTGDAQGGPAARIYGGFQEPDKVPAIYQELHLPTSVTAATISFDVRVIQTDANTPPQGEVLQGWLGVIPVSGDTPPDPNNAIVSGFVFDNPMAMPTPWQPFSVTLDQNLLNELNTARSNNQRLVVMLATFSNGFNLSLLVDNISFKVNGSQSVPAFTGEIVYVDGKSIKRINPAGGTPQTIWTHPDDAGEIKRVRWNPTATELAFSSDHERFFSPLEVDIYGIRADGSRLRRITNAPAQTEITSGHYRQGNVRLNIFNNASALQTFAPFVISIRGASELKSFVLPSYQQSSQILIENVADLGGEQAVIFIYSSAGCGANRRDAGGFVTIIPDQTVDLDVTFNATNCAGFVGAASDMTWKRDGTEIGYVLTNGAYRVAAAGSTGPGTPWFDAGGLIETVAWSPGDDTVLYDPIGPGGGIYKRNLASTEAGQQIVNRTVLADPQKPAWLPDGSGFLYIFGNDIYSADAQGENRQLIMSFPVGERALWASPAPDGTYLVFERQLGNVSTLWIMERTNPANMWQLTSGTKPDWSRVNPSVPDDQPTPPPGATATATVPPGATATATATVPPGATATATVPPGATPTATVPPSELTKRTYLPLVV